MQKKILIGSQPTRREHFWQVIRFQRCRKIFSSAHNRLEEGVLGRKFDSHGAEEDFLRLTTNSKKGFGQVIRFQRCRNRFPRLTTNSKRAFWAGNSTEKDFPRLTTNSKKGLGQVIRFPRCRKRFSSADNQLEEGVLGRFAGIVRKFQNVLGPCGRKITQLMLMMLSPRLVKSARQICSITGAVGFGKGLELLWPGNNPADAHMLSSRLVTEAEGFGKRLEPRGPCGNNPAGAHDALPPLRQICSITGAVGFGKRLELRVPCKSAQSLGRWVWQASGA